MGARSPTARSRAPASIVDADLAAIGRPRFYDLTTADGTPYEKIARLHGRHVLATTVVQTCVRYAENERCRFCTIEESLNSGATTHVKRPSSSPRSRWRRSASTACASSS